MILCYQVTQLLHIILPRLAEGFSDQRGAIFGFGPNAEEDTGTILKIEGISQAKRMKLMKAPIHNLNEERSVGFINYEISIRGKQYLEAASRKMIINKSSDLLDQMDASDINKFSKPAKAIKEIKLKWKKNIELHAKEAYSDKEKASLHEESIKYDLLERLKREEIPGPFTSEKEIRNYLDSKQDEKAKNKRLYDEIRYARVTCMSLKPTAAVFRLKRNHRNLTSTEYAENLISYLNSARCCKRITVDDLRNIMHGIAGRTDSAETVDLVEKESNTMEKQKEKQYNLGEHVIAFWLEGNVAKWYLGIVEAEKCDKLLISYMIRGDSKGQSWTFPETAEILETNFEQIIATKVKVQYLGSVRIRCNLVSKTLVTEMDKMVKLVEERGEL